MRSRPNNEKTTMRLLQRTNEVYATGVDFDERDLIRTLRRYLGPDGKGTVTIKAVLPDDPNVRRGDEQHSIIIVTA